MPAVLSPPPEVTLNMLRMPEGLRQFMEKDGWMDGRRTGGWVVCMSVFLMG